MTGLIVIDESGDLGSSGSRYFAMAGLVLMRPRHLKPVTKVFPNDGYEHKWSNSSPIERVRYFETLSECQFKAVVSVIEKNNPISKKCIYGNQLYEMMVRQLIEDAVTIRPCNDLRVYLDSCRFIKESVFRTLVNDVANDLGANIIDCGKRGSNETPCLQVVDFVAGASRAKSENEDKTLSIIQEKISVARRY